MSQDTCSIAGCNKEATASRGWCWTHYGRYRRYGDPTVTFQQKPCSVADCASQSRVSGMCDMHYRRSKKHGDVTVGRPNWGPDCTVDGCAKPAHQAGKCASHYYRHWVDNGAGRVRMSAASARRRARVAAAVVVDPKLSWRELWQEGERTCYLCGNECDPADFEYRDDRSGRPHKHCGPTHPSLDHVQALANGGIHHRSNARMACLRCNIAKGTRAHGNQAQHQTATA